MRDLLFLCGLLLSTTLNAQFSDKVLVGAFSSISYEGTPSSSALAVINNPSSLARINQGMLSIISTSPFGFSRWSSSCISVLCLGKNFNYGGSCWYEKIYSYTDFSVNSIVAKSIGPKMQIGVNFHYANERVAHYFSASQIGADFGYTYSISSKTKAGISLINFIGGNLNKTPVQSISNRWIGSLSYRPNSKFAIGVSLEKQWHQLPNITVGFEYKIVSAVSFQFGISTSVQTYFSSLSLKHKKVELTLMESCHQQLGFSTGLQISFLLPNSKK